MTEGEFVKFYKKRNKSKSHKEVKEKIDLFWDVLLEALDKDKKVVFKDWGIFEKKDIKVRKIVVPMWEEPAYTKPKKAIKFRAGSGLMEAVAGDKDE
ncbi:MAG: HU family DNA-binding protein [Fusobacterium ulcerans]|uniref:HU family DNA-binding protein n=1 Tax=Fusobacterium ulcerans TaxID=861 RepID=UPI003A86E851